MSVVGDQVGGFLIIDSYYNIMLSRNDNSQVECNGTNTSGLKMKLILGALIGYYPV